MHILATLSSTVSSNHATITFLLFKGNIISKIGEEIEGDLQSCLVGDEDMQTEIEEFNKIECYIIDPDNEHYSMLVWMGKEASISVRKECIRETDLRLKERKGGFITYIDEEYTTLPVRELVFSPKEFIFTMQRIYPSWTDVFQYTDEEYKFTKF